MAAENGPLYIYVDITLNNLPFPDTIVIYQMNDVKTEDFTEYNCCCKWLLDILIIQP